MNKINKWFDEKELWQIRDEIIQFNKEHFRKNSDKQIKPFLYHLIGQFNIRDAIYLPKDDKDILYNIVKYKLKNTAQKYYSLQNNNRNNADITLTNTYYNKKLYICSTQHSNLNTTIINIIRIDNQPPFIKEWLPKEYIYTHEYKEYITETTLEYNKLLSTNSNGFIDIYKSPVLLEITNKDIQISIKSINMIGEYTHCTGQMDNKAEFAHFKNLYNTIKKETNRYSENIVNKTKIHGTEWLYFKRIEDNDYIIVNDAGLIILYFNDISSILYNVHIKISKST